MPYDNCPFSVLGGTPRTACVVRRTDKTLKVATCAVHDVETTRYLGLSGIDFLASFCEGENRPMAELPLDAYRPYLATISMVFQNMYLGLLRATIRYATEYCRDRTAFGKPVVQFQAISQKLANMMLAYESSRVYVRDISCREHQISSMALLSADLLQKNGPMISLDAIQALGGHGFVQSHPLEKWMRDGQVLAMFLSDISRQLRSVR